MSYIYIYECIYKDCNVLRSHLQSHRLQLQTHIEEVVGLDDGLLVGLGGSLVLRGRGGQVVLVASHTAASHAAVEDQLQLDFQGVVGHQLPVASARNVGVGLEDTGHGQTGRIEEAVGVGGQQVAEHGVHGARLGGLEGLGDGGGHSAVAQHTVGILQVVDLVQGHRRARAVQLVQHKAQRDVVGAHTSRRALAGVGVGVQVGSAKVEGVGHAVNVHKATGQSSLDGGLEVGLLGGGQLGARARRANGALPAQVGVHGGDIHLHHHAVAVVLHIGKVHIIGGIQIHIDDFGIVQQLGSGNTGHSLLYPSRTFFRGKSDFLGSHADGKIHRFHRHTNLGAQAGRHKPILFIDNFHLFHKSSCSCYKGTNTFQE